MINFNWMNLAVITAEQVPPRTYFLRALQTPELIAAIRIGVLAMALMAILIFLKMKVNHRNGE